MAGKRFVLILGATVIPGPVLAANIRPAGPSGEGIDSAEVVVTTNALVDAKPDYQAGAHLIRAVGTTWEPEFTGIVDAVMPAGTVTTIKLVTGLQLLGESGIGGLGMDAETASIEAVWSLLRLWGVDADQIDLDGFQPGPTETFEVATSLDGIELAETIGFGGVLLLPSGMWSRMADGLGPQDLRKAYAEAEAWALTLVQARTWDEAETKGLKAIDIALAWLAIRTHYSTAVLPTEQPHRFRRAWTMSRVTRRDVVVVKLSSTGARWMRAPQDIASQPTLTLAEMEDLQSVVPLPPMPSVSLSEALLAWHRAAESSDPFAAVVALWEAIEWYSANAKLEPLFSKSELRAIRDRASQGLGEVQLERIKQVLDMLKQPSAMTRVEIALKEDLVPHTADEIIVLRKVRKIRNDLIHGRAREAPSGRDLKQATAIVSRMLVYRVHRIASEASNSVLWVSNLE